ncbi:MULTISPECIES: metallophosphoesterase [unclassified Paenibacillus]|uniref:metallophosphoesterase n=1 Tax=unclassified Paenibacillus TaxID=185978 RepID=UPI001AE1F208|nr:MULTISPECIES: metallophosphoesterase [unclassified Paenibacillus]MBP1153436.1 putative MPP superfamily phosphohydrolase [Paenibacillus sp. PvP091]MBP1171181.1 putative MPP superfamily phosphohydrolase [Paenibacillus sp. PvR098]MBP2442209.1 putative MPP superfamily phosphohydrolase [Paenibacillus sp. PvP052]
MEPNTSKPKRKISRRSFLKKAALTAAGIMAIPPTAYGYARYAERKWLEINEVNLSLPRLPQGMDGIRIVQFSDVHLGFHYDAGELFQLAETINGLQPEIICFTGDLVDYAIGRDGGRCVEALTAMKAKFGKFSVLGNHDYYNGPSKVTELLTKGGFRMLRNDLAAVERSGNSMWVAGVEDMWMGKPDIKKATRLTKPDDFVLLIAHCPDFADVALEHQVDLQLSGHSHGGQVRIPLLGHVVTPKFGKKYVIGQYTLGDGKLQLYVNRGIGVSQHPIRFLCRPELTVLTLRQA